MHHGRDGTYPVEAIEAEHRLGHVWKANEDTVAGTHAKCPEAARHLVNLLRKAGVACGLAHECKGREILFPGGSFQDCLRYCFFRIVKMRVHATVAFHPRSGNVINLIFHRG